MSIRVIFTEKAELSKGLAPKESLLRFLKGFIEAGGRLKYVDVHG